MSSNKIVLSTSSLFPLKIEETFRIAKDTGYDGVEVMVGASKETRNAHLLQDLAAQYDMPVLGIHAPVLILTHFIWGTDPALKLAKTAELAAAVGAKNVVVHPPFAFQHVYAQSFLQLCQMLEQGFDIKIAVENMFPWKTERREMAVYEPSWDTIVKEASHVTLDFSHSALSGLNVLQAAQQLQHKVAHIHLCDGLGVKTRKGVEKQKLFDEHLPPGEGNQPVFETLQFLGSIGWEGMIGTEVNTRKYDTLLDKANVLEKSVVFAREALNSGANSNSLKLAA